VLTKRDHTAYFKLTFNTTEYDLYTLAVTEIITLSLQAHSEGLQNIGEYEIKLILCANIHYRLKM
jgi:hypothetical protein